MIDLPQALCDQLVAHLRACLPAEGCGFLAGRHGRIAYHYPVPNQLASPVAYQMDAAAQLEALLEIEARGSELIAIYHSHPQGGIRPSASDIAQWRYPEAALLIVSLADAAGPQLAAYWLRAGVVGDCPLHIDSG